MRELLALVGLLAIAALVILLLLTPLTDIDCEYTTQCCSGNSIEDCIWPTSRRGYPTCPFTHPDKLGTSLSCTR